MFGWRIADNIFLRHLCAEAATGILVHPTSCYGANIRHKVAFRTMEIASTIKRIAFLGDHLPRQCGIATFTSDICEAVAAQFRECQCVVGAVNDRPEGYDYPAQVR